MRYFDQFTALGQVKKFQSLKTTKQIKDVTPNVRIVKFTGKVAIKWMVHCSVTYSTTLAGG